MTYWKSPAFKELQRTWYTKLEASGFEDAEQLIGADMMLKQIAAHAYRDMDELAIVTKEAYYRALSEMVQLSRFADEIDYVIMVMTSHGASIKCIIDALSERGTRRCRKTIRCTIRKYEMAWGLRRYNPRQLNKYYSPKTA